MSFKKAQPKQAALKLGIYGPTGGGKTLSSLLFAEGLAKLSGKKIAMVDTEHGSDFYAMDVPEREVHPAGFNFDALYTRQVFEVLKGVRSLDPSEYGVLIIDSMTHIWEACIAAYSGKFTKDGGIPMYAWGKIKKPYKDLIAWSLSTPIHVIYCGRQGNEFGENEKGEPIIVGYKMRAEGETQYEPHILVRTEVKEDKIIAHIEKDRTGILMGHTFVNPRYDAMIAPIVPLLGGEQASVNPDEDASADAEAAAEEQVHRDMESRALANKFIVELDTATTKRALTPIGKRIAAEKSKMTTHDIAAVRAKYEEKKEIFETAGV